jgi:hypothetical protein
LRPNSLTSTPNIAGKSYLYNALAIIENIQFFKNINTEPSKRYKYHYNILNVAQCFSMAKTFLKEDIDQYREECDIIKNFIKENSPFKHIFDNLKQ